MKKVYIETSIPSYIVARPHRDILIFTHQEITKEWWNEYRKNYESYISQIVIDEISLGNSSLAEKRLKLIRNIPLLEINKEIEELAQKYFKYFNFPQRAIRDAFHIACAVYYEIDFLLTWNCSHLANANIRSQLIDYNMKIGYTTPDICTPEELTI